MCAKFQVSTRIFCQAKPFERVSRFVTLDYSSKIHLCFEEFQILFLNQHVPNLVSLPADDWCQQWRSCFAPENYFVEHIVVMKTTCVKNCGSNAAIIAFFTAPNQTFPKSFKMWSSRRVKFLLDVLLETSHCPTDSMHLYNLSFLQPHQQSLFQYRS